MKKKPNKYLYGWKLYVNYGQGWEYEIFEETKAGYLENKRLYRENCEYPQRWTRGRESNPDYQLYMDLKTAITELAPILYP